MAIITIIILVIMTEIEKRNGKYTTIAISPSTMSDLADVMPKSWDWDRCIRELTEMWKNQQGKGIKSGKSA
jgi:hypothetical protein